MTWGDRARMVIESLLREADARGLEGPDRERFVRQNRPPWLTPGDGGGWPYRAWLEQVRMALRDEPARKPGDPRPVDPITLPRSRGRGPIDAPTPTIE